jgi:bifunctional DNA-binding transcriptional regulator/antitoxin component of YhaV-PrlF toxin-antitoxin module
MQNGHSLRMSIPRDVQRHLGIRRGDILAMELRGGGRVEFYKVDPDKIRSARVDDDSTGSD